MELKRRVDCKCAQCGITFQKLPCQLGRGRGRFCSKKCLGLSKRNGSELFCAWCDAVFYRRFGEQDRGERVNQFCSNPCYAEYRATYRHSYPKEGPRHKHRLVAESVLGRLLTSEEVVHHKDNNKQNYSPDNLAVFPNQATHMRCHRGAMSDEELRGFSLV
jgi:hypothetical protein